MEEARAHRRSRARGVGLSRYTIAEIRKTYGEDRAREEWYGDWASALIYRPISFWLTPALLRFSVSASAVTCTMLVLSLAMPALAAFAGRDALAPIVALAFTCMVLDCVDGNIARATGTSSEGGAYLDFLVDVVYRIAIYATIGILAAGYAFGLAVLAVALCLAARLCRFKQGPAGGEDLYAVEQAAAAGPGAWITRYAFPFLSGTDRMLPFFLLLAGWCNALEWLVAWLLAYAAVDFVYTQVAVVERMRGRR